MKKYLLLFSWLFLMLLTAGQPVFGMQYFDSAVGYYVGPYPVGIATADLNNDSILDIVTANYAGNSVTVILGIGDGTFSNRINYSIGTSQSPVFVAIGDINGDLIPDIVSGGTMGLEILFGVGDGTFGASVNHYFVEQVHDIVLADFNNDNHLDIATSHVVRDSVGIHINNNDSTFTTHLVPCGYGSRSLAKGHLDGDNYIDLLVGCNDGTVWQLSNDQSGSFVSHQVHIGVLSDPATVAIDDINNDSNLDFAVIHSANDFLFTYFKDDDTTYSNNQALVVTDNPTSIHFQDVNGDTEDDILMTIGTTDEIQVYLNHGSGAFSFDTSYTVASTPKDLTFGDFDGDGYIDMAATSYSTDQVGIFINRLSLILSVDDVDVNGVLPTQYSLEQNYPNPFNPDTKIRFSLPTGSDVKVEVFNMLGQSVMVLVDEYLSAGTKEITWNGVNSSGNKVSSGVYLYKITADNFTDSKRMLLLK